VVWLRNTSLHMRRLPSILTRQETNLPSASQSTVQAQRSARHRTRTHDEGVTAQNQRPSSELARFRKLAQSQLAREESVGGQVGGVAQRMQEMADCLTIFYRPRRLGCSKMRPDRESLGTSKTWQRQLKSEVEGTFITTSNYNRTLNYVAGRSHADVVVLMPNSRPKGTNTLSKQVGCADR
jgi:hypothetical protein